METSDEWEVQLVQLSKTRAGLARALGQERTGVVDPKKSVLCACIRKEKKLSHKTQQGDGSCGKQGKESINDHDGLCDIASVVPLMGSNNEFIRHSAKKILSAFADYLLLKDQKWLWMSLMHNVWDAVMLGCKSDKTLMAKEDKSIRGTELTSSCSERRSGPLIICGMEVLRCILKTCQNEEIASNIDNTMMFLGILEENISIVVQILKSADEPSQGDHPTCLGRGLALGAFLQLLCTSIGCCNSEVDDELGATDFGLVSSLLEKIGKCIPVLASMALRLPHMHFLGAHCSCLFVRHKFLRIMIGLSKRFDGNHHNLALMCLRAICNEGADLINFYVIGDKPSTSTWSSAAFSTRSLRWPSKNTVEYSVTHLQCRALFLLLKICILSAGAEIEPSQQPEKSHKSSTRVEQEIEPWNVDESLNGLEDVNELLIVEGMTEGAFSTSDVLRQEASEAVRRWLKLQGVGVTTADKIRDFSLAFVVLYSDEDDMMIEMLLMLCKMTPLLLPLVEKDLRQCIPVVTALGQAELFHAFLRTVSYDHTVLVDFLITQNTGTLFLRYLMLCTGLFINTWPDVFSMTKSMDCLVQLKAAIERLHHRKLFPYNPAPLLKRLGVLEDLHQQRARIE